MKFNDKDLSDIITILKGFTPFGGANYELDTKDSVSNGVYFYKNRFREKILKVPFFVTYPTVERYDYLQSVLAVDEPKRLEFSHLPDRYYLAIPTGDLDFEEFRMNGKGTITFLIPDGVAHSETYKKVTDYTESDGKMIFNIVNKGNVEALPIITIKHSSDNGYLGFVNSLSTFEVGNLEEYDREDVKHSEILVDFKDGKLSNMLTSGAKNVAILNDSQQTITGSLGQKIEFERNHIYLADAGTGQGIHGASLSFDIPADSVGGVGSLNEILWARQIFWPLNVNQCGFIKLAVSDVDGKFMYGSEVVKRSNGQKMEYNVSISSETGFTTIFSKTFDSNNYNPFFHKQGWSEIARNNDQLDIYYWGSRHKVSAPSLKDRKALKVHVFLGAVGSRPLPTYMFIDGLYVKKNFTNLQEDVPNTFSSGTEVIINSENDTLLVDNIPKINAIVDGSDFLKIPVGTSQLELYKSSWATTAPTVGIKFEERYL